MMEQDTYKDNAELPVDRDSESGDDLEASDQDNSDDSAPPPWMVYPCPDEFSRETLLATVDKVWPRRLLDICTMTSFERGVDNVYGDFPSPRYNILSYTWGRFKVRDPQLEAGSERLGIAGVSWEIPAIDPNRFTVASFQHTLNQIYIMTGTRFIWLDVACIDQQNEAAKMEEVAKQTGIFANAHQAFIWLWTIPTETLKRDVGVVLSCRPGGGDRLEQARGLQAITATLSRFKTSVDNVLDDFWFSSLWTVQEEALQRFAVILSREAEPVESPDTESNYNRIQSIFKSIGKEYTEEELLVSDTKVTIAQVTRGLNNMFSLLGDPLSIPVLQDPQLTETIQHLEKRIRDGRYYLGTVSNPNAYFGRASGRVVSVKLDRIYGIMGLYNIRVGATVPGQTSTRYTLSQLEEEFVITLNTKSAFLGQLFLHTERPRPGTTWQITQNCRVPVTFSDWDNCHVTFDDCTITARPGSPALIQGRLTPFKNLMQFWQVAHGLDDGYSLIIRLDDYICSEHPIIPYLDPQTVAKVDSMADIDVERTLNGLTSTFGVNRLSVVHLGYITTGNWHEVPGILYVAGLLVLHEESERGKCQRLGLCQWYGEAHDNCPKGLQPQWELYKGIIS